MAKLCVIAAGLFAIAPAKGNPGNDKEKAAILMMRRVAADAKIGDRSVPRHMGKVRFLLRSGPEWKPLSEEKVVRFEPAGNDSCQIVNPQRFLHLRDFHPNAPNVRSRSECTGDSAGACNVNGSPGLTGRVVLQGGEIRPVQLTGVSDLSDISDVINNDVEGSRTVVGTQEQDNPEKPAANGLIYLRTLQGGTATLFIGEEPFSLAPAGPGDAARLRQLLGSNEETWFVVWVTNTREEADAFGSPQDDHDPDFDFLYDFLQDGSLTRWVPKLRDNSVIKTPPEKCMPVIVDR